METGPLIGTNPANACASPLSASGTIEGKSAPGAMSVSCVPSANSGETRPAKRTLNRGSPSAPASGGPSARCRSTRPSKRNENDSHDSGCAEIASDPCTRWCASALVKTDSVQPYPPDAVNVNHVRDASGDGTRHVPGSASRSNPCAYGCGSGAATLCACAVVVHEISAGKTATSSARALASGERPRLLLLSCAATTRARYVIAWCSTEFSATAAVGAAL